MNCLWVFFYFFFSPGAHSFLSYSRHSRGGLNLGAAAQTTRMASPKNDTATINHFGRMAEWFVQKRIEILLGYFSYHRRPINVPPGCGRTSAVLIPRPNVNDYFKEGIAAWQRYYRLYVIHPATNVSFLSPQSDTRYHTAPARHSDRNRRKENDSDYDQQR